MIEDDLELANILTQYLKQLVDGTKLVKKAIGEISYPIVSLKDQRSLIIVKDVKKGEIS